MVYPQLGLGDVHSKKNEYMPSFFYFARLTILGSRTLVTAVKVD